MVQTDSPPWAFTQSFCAGHVQRHSMSAPFESQVVTPVWPPPAPLSAITEELTYQFATSEAVLPAQEDVTDPVPAAWRPLACIARKVVDVEPVTLSPATMAPIATTPSPTIRGFCNNAVDCVGNNFACDSTTNKCVCPSGFAKVGPNCQLENECAAGFQNNCHRNAICKEEPAPFFYSCACSDGFAD